MRRSATSSTDAAGLQTNIFGRPSMPWVTAEDHRGVDAALQPGRSVAANGEAAAAPDWTAALEESAETQLADEVRRALAPDGENEC